MIGKTFIVANAALALALTSSVPSHAQDPAPADEAESVMWRAYEVYGGDDTFSRLSFQMEIDGGKTSTVSLVMGFKRDAGEDAGYRVIMFNELPPDRKDIGFLGVFHDPALGKEDEMWLYLPELRSTRRLTHQIQSNDGRSGHDHGHMGHMRHDSVSDEFSASALNHEELMPRWPGFDRHRMLAIEDIDGRPAYKIESIPLDPESSTYGKRIQWIDRENALLLRIEYHDVAGTLVKTQTQTWRQNGDAWLWDRVTAVDHASGRRTLLEHTDVQVNLGLPDDLFSRRVLTRGGKAFEGRIAGHTRR